MWITQINRMFFIVVFYQLNFKTSSFLFVVYITLNFIIKKLEIISGFLLLSDKDIEEPMMKCSQEFGKNRKNFWFKVEVWSEIVQWIVDVDVYGCKQWIDTSFWFLWFRCFWILISKGLDLISIVEQKSKGYLLILANEEL